ncbi:MAG: isoprenylcysteine carboxylmethyltransferase family protein [Acidobacteria bacterium]|nr:isoprenylcysteine carboxylmethyltransferase family protein [Acidobacteriota bacterium]MDA1237004.1 isoprenylcysteine carboxylmethyltransferase family protein [Acidobacteriota bacterium]
MAFPKQFAEFVARTRVVAGFIVLGLFLWLSTPTLESVALGGAIGLIGVLIRAWAAGHLAKNQQLATSGPYAYVRNPLYVGTLIAGIGFGVAGAHWAIAALLVAFFILYYLPVVEEEERHLAKILPGYDEYREKTPKLLPRLTPAYLGGPSFRRGLYLRNQEYQALFGYLFVLAILAGKAVLVQGPS